MGINVVHYGDTRNETTNKKETTQIHESGKINKSDQKVLSEVSEKTDSKLDEIEKKRKRKKETQKMRTRPIYTTRLVG